MANTTQLGTITALLTMSLLIPAGWDSLGADGPEGSQDARPAIQTLQLDGARVEVRVDRPVVEAGQRVRVALSAYSSSRENVEVMVALQAEDSMQMSRMPSPPVTLESERMLLAANGTPREISFVLAGNEIEGIDPMQLAGGIRQYTVLVTEGGKPAPENDAAAEPQLAMWGGGAVGNAAMVQVAARQKPAYEVALSFDGVDADGAATGTVRIRNLTRKTLKEINIDLTSYPTFTLSGGDFQPADWSVEMIGDDAGQIAELAPRATRSIRFRAKLEGGASRGTLYANVWASYGGMGTDSEVLDLGAVATNPAPFAAPPARPTSWVEPAVEPAAEPIAMQFAEPPPAME